MSYDDRQAGTAARRFVCNGRRVAQITGASVYRKLNELLAEAEFDRWIERRCRHYYINQEKRGQPSVPPGVYFHLMLVGYFEGIDSQRGIAWRCADSLSLHGLSMFRRFVRPD